MFTGILTILLLSGFFKYEHSMLHVNVSAVLEQQCMLVLALCHGFQIHLKQHTARSLQNWFLQSIQQ
jgi:hypothetical protein